MRAVREPVVEVAAEGGGERFCDAEGVEAFAVRALFQRR
jgi:hypothetical protein